MTELKRRIKVFLCHAHSDAPAVYDLFRYLRREGVDVWLDKEKLLPGADWDLEIRRAVRESDAVIVCLSRKSVSKEGYVQKEIKLALDIEEEKPEGVIFLIPARLEECEVPNRLSKWHWVDLFEEGGHQKLIYALRERGDNIGASLRRRRGATPLAHPLKSQDRENLIEPTTVITNTQEERQHEKLGVYSGIWIDPVGHVWRDSERLGPLDNDAELRLLAYLVEHKGEVCSYTSLLSATFWLSPKEGSVVTADPMIDAVVHDVRKHVEKNPTNPKILMKVPGIGYILKK